MLCTRCRGTRLEGLVAADRVGKSSAARGGEVRGGNERDVYFKYVCYQHEKWLRRSGATATCVLHRYERGEDKEVVPMRRS